MIGIAAIRKTFCLQSYHHDCGAACINSILGYFYFGKMDTLELIENKKGINLLAIKKTLEKKGIEVQAFHCKEKQFPTMDELSLIVVQQHDENHVLLVYPHQNKDGDLSTVLIGNPASGIYWQKKDEIKWEGMIMTFKYHQTTGSLKPMMKGLFALQYDTYKRHFLKFNVVIFWGLVVNILTISLPIIFQTALDHFKVARNQEKILSYVLMICFILFIRAGISYVRKNLIANFASDYYYENIKAWFSDIGKSKSSFWATLNHGDFNKLLKEQHQLQQLNLLSLIEIVSDVVQLVFLIGLSFYYSVFIGSLLLLFILINQTYIFRNARGVGQKQEDLKTAQAIAEQSFIVCCDQFDALKAEGYDVANHSPILNHFTNLYHCIRKYGLYHNSIQWINDMMSHAVYGVAIFIILYEYCRQHLSLGEMLTLIGLLYYSLPIITKVAHSIQFYYEQVPNLGKRQLIKNFGKESSIKIELFDSLCIVNGRHKHSVDCRDINLKIKCGDFLLVKGENGVGKSSLLNLIAGNLALTAGSLYVNNEQMRDEYTICGLSFLKQDVPIFDGTVKYNISLANDKVTDFNQFIRLFNLGRFLDQFEDKEQTVLCHSKENLSGGQKKILGFARALYKKPKFLLLDEPELGLDKNNLSWLLDVLPMISKRATIVICSHSRLYDGMVNKVSELS